MKEWIYRGTDDGHILNSEPSKELVRCKDCKEYGCDTYLERGDDNWFCADGERKSE